MTHYSPLGEKTPLTSVVINSVITLQFLFQVAKLPGPVIVAFTAEKKDFVKEILPEIGTFLLGLSMAAYFI